LADPRAAGYALAVDIGGTFTDVVLRHRDGRPRRTRLRDLPAQRLSQRGE
jgi:N-methylhydantoinase A/oxoprolinase/acetone carboxylase beta subunit